MMMGKTHLFLDNEGGRSGCKHRLVPLVVVSRDVRLGKGAVEIHLHARTPPKHLKPAPREGAIASHVHARATKCAAG